MFLTVFFLSDFHFWSQSLLGPSAPTTPSYLGTVQEAAIKP